MKLAGDDTNDVTFAELDVDEEVDEEDIEAANEADLNREVSDSMDIEEVTWEVDEELGLTWSDINLGCFTLTKVCLYPSVNIFIAIYSSIQLTKLAKWIFHLPVLHKDLIEACTKAKIKPKNVMWSVLTCWSLVAEMLWHSLYLHPALEKLVIIKHHNTAKSAQLKCFKLKKEEWDL